MNRTRVGREPCRAMAERRRRQDWSCPSWPPKRPANWACWCELPRFDRIRACRPFRPERRGAALGYNQPDAPTKRLKSNNRSDPTQSSRRLQQRARRANARMWMMGGLATAPLKARVARPSSTSTRPFEFRKKGRIPAWPPVKNKPNPKTPRLTINSPYEPGHDVFVSSQCSASRVQRDWVLDDKQIATHRFGPTSE